MSDIEALLQRELRRVTDQVQSAELRPLRTPRRRAATRRRWVLPSIAIGGVALCAALALLLTNVIVLRSSSQAPAPTPMPRFFVTFAGYLNGVGAKGGTPTASFTVRDSADGRITGTATITSSSWNDTWSVNAAADDRMFILTRLPDATGSHALTVYRLPLTESGAAGRITRIGSFPISANIGTAIALSQDGTRLAVPLIHIVAGAFVKSVHGEAGPTTYAGIETINLLTGDIRTWMAQGDEGYWAGTPSWGTGDSTLTFPWLRVGPTPWAVFTRAQLLDMTLVGIRRLDTTAPGTNLMSSQLVPFPTPVAVAASEQAASLPSQWLAITNDGSSIFGVSCHATGIQSGTVTMKIVKMSAATGQVTDVLREQAVSYSVPAERTSDLNNCASSIWSVDASGQHLLVTAWQFGRIDNGVFTPLPDKDILILLHLGSPTAW